MKDLIVDCLARFGWRKDRIVNAFSKTFETVVAPSKASIWLKFDQECNRWWLTNGDFTSAGENVLAAAYAIFPVGMPQNEIERTIAAFVDEMERKIAGAYSVRLLGLLGNRSQSTLHTRP
ncbi:hypothetical protein [Ralstonia pseudosolanacearum]|uniref:hypothetical protein n=1 Tax=Ralstonia pseudosolanacearum TaxID=1310165 RepID=UPI003CEFA061